MPLGLHPEIGIAVAFGHRLAGDLQDVPEARGDDQAERVDLALQQRVGRDRRAVRDAGDAVRRRADLLAGSRARRAPEPMRRIGRRARHLGDGIAPDAVSTQTISVKVPPVSIPIRKRALLMACAMVTLGCSRKPAGCLAWFVTQKKRRERAAIRSSVCINRRGPDRIGRNEKRPAVADGAFVIRNGLSRACRWAHRRGGLPRRPQVLPDRSALLL